MGPETAKTVSVTIVTWHIVSHTILAISRLAAEREGMAGAPNRTGKRLDVSIPTFHRSPDVTAATVSAQDERHAFSFLCLASLSRCPCLHLFRAPASSTRRPA